MKPGKLVIIEPNGNRMDVGYPDKPTLEQLQAAVGGYIERVRVRVDGRVRDGYVNEDGLAQDLPVNFSAMKLLAPPFDPAITVLVGNLAVWVADPPIKSHGSSDAKYRVQSVVGSRGKSWQIVNVLGGLVKYFDGTRRQAETEAKKLECTP